MSKLPGGLSLHWFFFSGKSRTVEIANLCDAIVALCGVCDYFFSLGVIKIILFWWFLQLNLFIRIYSFGVTALLHSPSWPSSLRRSRGWVSFNRVPIQKKADFHIFAVTLLCLLEQESFRIEKKIVPSFSKTALVSSQGSFQGLLQLQILVHRPPEQRWGSESRPQAGTCIFYFFWPSLLPHLSIFSPSFHMKIRENTLW